MTIQQLRYVVELSRHSSISKAALAAYTTQPNISKAMRDLEEELGITILARTNKGVAFTKQGTELLFYARLMLEQAESIVHHFSPQNHDTLNCAVSSQYFVAVTQAIARLMNSVASYVITLREGKTMDVVEDVYMGKSVLGVISLTQQNEFLLKRYFKTRDLVFSPIISTSHHVFVHKKHPLAARKSIALAELEPYPFLTFQQDDVPLHFAEEALNAGREGKLVYVQDRGTMHNLLQHTNGYNLGSGCIVKGFMSPWIAVVPLEEGKRIEIGVVKRKNVFLPDQMQMFVNYLKQALIHSAPRGAQVIESEVEK